MNGFKHKQTFLFRYICHLKWDAPTLKSICYGYYDWHVFLTTHKKRNYSYI